MDVVSVRLKRKRTIQVVISPEGSVGTCTSLYLLFPLNVTYLCILIINQRFVNLSILFLLTFYMMSNLKTITHVVEILYDPIWEKMCRVAGYSVGLSSPLFYSLVMKHSLEYEFINEN